MQRAACRLCLAACVAPGAGVAAAQLPAYVPDRPVAGTIRVCGSPQMGDLLKLYEQGFRTLQPRVRFDDSLTSTLAAVAGVASGQAEIGLLGREIWPAEIQSFESSRRHRPVVIDVATGSYDVPKATFAMMIFVPKSNPISRLSTGQLERIFAASDRPILTWGDLGLKGKWAGRPIHPYGFAVGNDKSLIFGHLIFSQGEHWRPDLKEFSNGPGPAGSDAGELIVNAVANDPNGIGISNVHYATPGVKALALSTREHSAPIAPTRENVATRRYPLTRAVYMVLDNDPAHPPSATVVEFLRYVVSRQGQQAVTLEGNYLPLTREIARKQLELLAAISH